MSTVAEIEAALKQLPVQEAQNIPLIKCHSPLGGSQAQQLTPCRINVTFRPSSVANLGVVPSLKLGKWANQQRPFPSRAILGEESLAALVGDQKDALRGRGGAAFVGLVVAGHEVVARDYSVLLIGI